MENQQTKVFRINGQEYVSPTELMTPEDVKEAAGIDPSRKLIRQGVSANEILCEGEPILIQDGDHFADAPTFKYG